MPAEHQHAAHGPRTLSVPSDRSSAAPRYAACEVQDEKDW